MGYLNGKTVYLSGPIFHLKNDGTPWRDKVTPELKKFGLKVLDPCKKHATMGSEVQSEIGKSKEQFSALIREEKWEDLKKAFWRVLVMGPLLPFPTTIPSTERIGVTSAAVPVRNNSSAR